MKGSFILENKIGQVVRTFQWKEKGIFLVYRHDTRRVVPMTSTSELDDKGISYTVLADVNREDVIKKPVRVGTAGTLRFVEDMDSLTADLSPSAEHTKEDDKKIIFFAKWTTGIQMALLLIAFLVGHFVNFEAEKLEEQTVTVVERPESVQQIMDVSDKPVKTPKTKVAEVPHKANQETTRMKFSKTKVATTPVPAKAKAVNQMGALGVLGAVTGHVGGSGGLALNQVKTSGAAGLGGVSGSGGSSASVYGKGLVGAPLGSGGKASGTGGYGTRGKGGGQNGYGTNSMVGSSGAYFQAVEGDSLVEGGLDKDQIAAVVNRNIGQIRYCYEQGLQTQPSLRGRVSVHWLIGASGSVTTAKVVNTSLHSASVEGCMISKLKGWRFPQPKGGVTVRVTYPFVLGRVSQG